MHRVIDDTGTLSTPLKTLCRLRAALWILGRTRRMSQTWRMGCACQFSSVLCRDGARTMTRCVRSPAGRRRCGRLYSPAASLPVVARAPGCLVIRDFGAKLRRPDGSRDFVLANLGLLIRQTPP